MISILRHRADTSTSPGNPPWRRMPTKRWRGERQRRRRRRRRRRMGERK
jgi:hypothetical protein